MAEGGYDNVLQDINRLEAEERAPDVVVLIPWTQRLFGASGLFRERVEGELAFWRQAWEAAGRMGSRILQVGYDWVSPGAEGYGLAGEPGSPVDLVRTTNARTSREQAARLVLPRLGNRLRHDGAGGLLRPAAILLDQAAVQRARALYDWPNISGPDSGS